MKFLLIIRMEKLERALDIIPTAMSVIHWNLNPSSVHSFWISFHGTVSNENTILVGVDSKELAMQKNELSCKAYSASIVSPN